MCTNYGSEHESCEGGEESYVFCHCTAVPLNGLSTRAASDARKIMVTDAVSFKVSVAFFLEWLIYIYSASAEAASGDHVPLFTCSGHMEKFHLLTTAVLPEMGL